MDTEQTFRTEVKVTAAWDRREERRGQHGCDLLFLLHGSKATLVFEVRTGWYIDPQNNRVSGSSDIAYHAHSPISEDDSCREDCGWLGGKCCYSSRFGNSSEFFQTLVEKGSDGLWEEMKRLYHDLLDKEPEWLVEPYEQMAAVVKQIV